MQKNNKGEYVKDREIYEEDKENIRDKGYKKRDSKRNGVYR